MQKPHSLPGRAYPLGATWDGKGTNFAIFAAHAERVELCFFDEQDQEVLRVFLYERDHDIFHGYFESIGPGQRYGYRVYGPYFPEEGKRYNSNKLLLDPYAKAFSGDVLWNEAIFGYQINKEEKDLSFSESDSAAFVPKSIVIDPEYNWGNDVPPEHPYHKTIIYELHVKGFSRLNPLIPEPLRGTYAGLVHPESLNYLTSLGITAVELMPVHQFVSDGHLLERKLENYWGYNTIGFFAPESRYAAYGTNGNQVKEFKDMVKALHLAGIEVILDVVYNHTAEGNQDGPTLAFKGIDNEAYYRLEEIMPRYYTDYTGTGNTLNTRMPVVLRLMMDSLRYWITEMHVDGFRFDLASTLARGLHEVDCLSSFFDIIHQDPVISKVKLIAEPWDVGAGGYQVGKFPPGWAEWNDEYRDLMRSFWKGDPGKLGEFAQRFLGSPDLYRKNYRRPTASINFITAHDGFTLNDLVSYNEKHNEANGDENTDGESENLSWNCGVEGETVDVEILELRRKQRRNFLATLFLSQGVPMLSSGDELGKTQRGNNNCYCQDNELSWMAWDKADQDLLAFTKMLIELRLKHPSLSRREWIVGEQIAADGLSDIAWFSASGKQMEHWQWDDSQTNSIGIFLHGDGIQGKGPQGENLMDKHFLLLFNAGAEAVEFQIPDAAYSKVWIEVVNTAFSTTDEVQIPASASINLPARCVLVFRAV